jgi:hypothetical protein
VTGDSAPDDVAALFPGGHGVALEVQIKRAGGVVFQVVPGAVGAIPALKGAGAIRAAEDEHNRSAT